MKKLTVLFVIFTISVAAFSQAHLGLKAGINFSKLTERPYYSTESNNIKPKWEPGLTYGIVGDIAVTDIFFMQLEVLYSQLGTRYDLPASLPNGEVPQTNSPSGTLTKNYNTLQIPIVAKFTTYETKVTWYFDVGFFWAYFIDGKYTLTSTDNSIDEAGDISFDEFQREDFGFVLGLGLGTKLGKNMSWSLNLRYNRGVIDLNTNHGNQIADYVPTTTRGLSATLILFVL